MSSLQNSYFNLTNSSSTADTVKEALTFQGHGHFYDRSDFAVPNLAAEGKVSFYIEVGAAPILLMDVSFGFNEDQINYRLVEDVTSRNGGSNVTSSVRNLNRNIATPPPLLSSFFRNYSSINTTMSTTIVDISIFGAAGQGNQSGPGVLANSDTFLILKPNIDYAFEFSNASTSTVDTTFSIDLAELPIGFTGF